MPIVRVPKRCLNGSLRFLNVIIQSSRISKHSFESSFEARNVETSGCDARFSEPLFSFDGQIRVNQEGLLSRNYRLVTLNCRPAGRGLPLAVLRGSGLTLEPAVEPRFNQEEKGDRATAFRFARDQSAPKWRCCRHRLRRSGSSVSDPARGATARTPRMRGRTAHRVFRGRPRGPEVLRTSAPSWPEGRRARAPIVGPGWSRPGTRCILPPCIPFLRLGLINFHAGCGILTVEQRCIIRR